MSGACQAFRMSASDVIAGLESGFFNETFLVGGIMTYCLGGKNLQTILGHSSKSEGKIVQNIGGGRTRETNVIKTPESLAAHMGVRGMPDNLDELLSGGFDVVGVPVA